VADVLPCQVTLEALACASPNLGHAAARAREWTAPAVRGILARSDASRVVGSSPMAADAGRGARTHRRAERKSLSRRSGAACT